MKTKKLSLTFFALILIFTCTLCGCSFSGKTPDEIVKMRLFFMDNKYIIHACGMISDEDGNEYDYTNSKEALTNSLNNGNKIIEIDFHYTSDHELVCGHAWGDLYLDGKQLTPGEAPTLSDFLRCKVQNKFTPLTFEDVTKFMEENKDFYVVTDTKGTDIETYKMIAEKYPDLAKRFIVQIYHASEYDDVKKAGFPYIIYTLYEATEDELTEKALLKAAKKPLIGFTFHSDLASDSDFVYTMLKTKTPMFVHTVNDDFLIDEFLNMGISGIYTDRTNLVTKATE
ncbi:glycerophosphodiester phosphodiesterase family protein [Butyrivibrio sp. FC2001]|uniref:glycerophosphodiester phosphodiesterase family protein n=1 Tax=Butyrivibrio sp. FC2001 TaxID=1280671 RepID=UPI00040FF886|nr:glycerophosphodiester phosphodiesterase family protein [Butyrivibrio sp. FC2001]